MEQHRIGLDMIPLLIGMALLAVIAAANPRVISGASSGAPPTETVSTAFVDIESLRKCQ